jgi:hypothetical protein
MRSANPPHQDVVHAATAVIELTRNMVTHSGTSRRLLDAISRLHTVAAERYWANPYTSGVRATLDAAASTGYAGHVAAYPADPRVQAGYAHGCVRSAIWTAGGEPAQKAMYAKIARIVRRRIPWRLVRDALQQYQQRS